MKLITIKKYTDAKERKMEEQNKEGNAFKIDTLRRRLHYLIKRVDDDSVGARRFNLMEIEALKSAIVSLEKEGQFDEVSSTLVSLVTTISTGTEDEMVEIVDHAHNVIDRYQI